MTDQAQATAAKMTASSIAFELSQTQASDLPGSTLGGFKAAPGSRARLEPGTVLGDRYVLGALLGAGGMGAVYAAEDKNRGEEIALKVLLPGLVKNDEARARFHQEASLSSKLSHPNIVNVFDVQSVDGQHFLTMERLVGETLRARMERRRAAGETWSIQEALDVLRPVGEALGYAHGEGAQHRDVKPENVFLCEDGTVKLLDFGLARLLSASQLTSTGAALGTAYYMAPEMLVGDTPVDARADQYGLGVVLYELLTGRLPSGRFKPVSDARDDVPAAFESALDRALDGDPEQRFANVADLMAAAEAGAGQKPRRRARRARVRPQHLAALACVAAVVAAIPFLVGPAQELWTSLTRDPVAEQRALDAHDEAVAARRAMRAAFGDVALDDLGVVRDVATAEESFAAGESAATAGDVVEAGDHFLSAQGAFEGALERGGGVLAARLETAKGLFELAHGQLNQRQRELERERGEGYWGRVEDDWYDLLESDEAGESRLVAARSQAEGHRERKEWIAATARYEQAAAEAQRLAAAYDELVRTTRRLAEDVTALGGRAEALVEAYRAALGELTPDSDPGSRTALEQVARAAREAQAQDFAAAKSTYETALAQLPGCVEHAGHLARRAALTPKVAALLHEIEVLAPIFSVDCAAQLDQARARIAAAEAAAGERELGPLVATYEQSFGELEPMLADMHARVNEDITTAGERALHGAVAHGIVDAIPLLVAAGAEVDHLCENSFTPLAFAALRGNSQCIDALLNAGADIDKQVSDERNAVWTAIRFGQVEALRVLVARGASLEGTSWLPLHESVQEEQLEIVRFLIEEVGVDVDARAQLEVDGDRETALGIAARYQREEFVDLLLANGADPDKSDQDGFTPLMQSAYRGNLRIVNALLEHGANVNGRCSEEHGARTAFFYAQCGCACDSTGFEVGGPMPPEEPYQDRGYLDVLKRLLEVNSEGMADCQGATNCHVFRHADCEAMAVQEFISEFNHTQMVELYRRALRDFGYDDSALEGVAQSDLLSVLYEVVGLDRASVVVASVTDRWETVEARQARRR